MLYLKTEDQKNFCCSDCLTGTSVLDLDDLSLDGLKIPYTNRSTNDFLLKPGDKKIISDCSEFRFIGMAVSKPIKFRHIPKFESGLYWFCVSISPSNAIESDGSFSCEFTIQSHSSSFNSAPDHTVCFVNPNINYTKEIVSQILTDSIQGNYPIEFELFKGTNIKFTLTVGAGNVTSISSISVSGMYNTSETEINSGQINFLEAKKYFKLNNIYMSDMYGIGDVDKIELYNDSLEESRVILLTCD